MPLTHSQSLELIERIKSQPIFWKRGIRRSTDVIQRSWNLLGAEIGINPKSCKVRWLSLKAMFKQHLHQMQETHKKYTNWIYFPHLFFLKDLWGENLSKGIYGMDYYEKNAQIYELGDYRNVTSDFDDPLIDIETKLSNENDFEIISSKPPELVILKDYDNDENSIEINTSGKLKRRKVVEKSPQILKKPKIELNLTNESKSHTNLVPPSKIVSGSEYIFLMSLSPFLKALPDNRKLTVRMNLQQILVTEDLNYDIWNNCNDELETNLLDINDSDSHFLISLVPFLKAIVNRKKLKIRTKMMEILRNEDPNSSIVIEQINNNNDDDNNQLIETEELNDEIYTEHEIEHVDELILSDTNNQSIDDDDTTTNNMSDIVANLQKELKALKREVNESKIVNAGDGPNSSMFQLNIPCTTVDEFEALETFVATDQEAFTTLKTILMRTLDPTFDKYIKNCLKSVLADSAAVKYSWYGKGQTHKIPIKSYRVIALIEDCAMQKFSGAKPYQYLKIMIRWFHYAKGRIDAKEGKLHPFGR